MLNCVLYYEAWCNIAEIKKEKYKWDDIGVGGVVSTRISSLVVLRMQLAGGETLSTKALVIKTITDATPSYI